MTPTPSQSTQEAVQRYFDIRKRYPDQADRQLAEIIQSTVDAQIAEVTDMIVSMIDQTLSAARPLPKNDK